MLVTGKIIIKERNTVSFMNINDISHITCSGSLCTIHNICEKPKRVSKLLKQYEEELAESGFVRVNHNTLVNCNHISTVKLGKAHKLTLCNNIEINISRRKISIIHEYLR